MSQQQTLQRIQGLIGLGKVSKQSGVVRCSRLAPPLSAKLLENLAKTFLSVDQTQNFSAVFAWIDGYRDARMLVLVRYSECVMMLPIINSAISYCCLSGSWRRAADMAGGLLPSTMCGR